MLSGEPSFRACSNARQPVLCTYGEIYGLGATIDIDGQAYSSNVVRQATKPRGWTHNFNRAGCEATRFRTRTLSEFPFWPEADVLRPPTVSHVTE